MSNRTSFLPLVVLSALFGLLAPGCGDAADPEAARSPIAGAWQGEIVQSSTFDGEPLGRSDGPVVVRFRRDGRLESFAGELMTSYTWARLVKDQRCDTRGSESLAAPKARIEVDCGDELQAELVTTRFTTEEATVLEIDVDATGDLLPDLGEEQRVTGHAIESYRPKMVEGEEHLELEVELKLAVTDASGETHAYEQRITGMLERPRAEEAAREGVD